MSHASKASFDDETVGNHNDEYAPLRAFAGERDRTLILFDARLVAYASHHTRDLSAGVSQTSVLHGIMHAVAGLCSSLNTRRWLLVWDGHNSAAGRRAVYKPYKIRQDRDRTDQEEAERVKLTKSIATCQSALSSYFGAPQLKIGNLEADDLIGYISRFAYDRLITKGVIDRVVIITNDKDYYQLVKTDAVAVWRPGQQELVTAETLRELYELTPKQFISYKAYVGEGATGDNIPGVEGVGDTWARKFVGTHGSAVKHLASLAKRRADGEKLTKLEAACLDQRKNLRISLSLSRIRTTLDGLQAMLHCDPKLEGQPLTPFFQNAIKADFPRQLTRALTVSRKVPDIRRALEFDDDFNFTSIDPQVWGQTVGFRL